MKNPMARIARASAPESAAMDGSRCIVRLVKIHTHGGLTYEAGSELIVSAPERDWLAAQGVIATASPSTQPTHQE